jgi:PAS domain S-box-containing protein
MPNRPRFSLLQLEAIIDAVSSGIVVCAPDGHVVAMNRAALALHGMANSDEIVQRDGDFSQVFETTTPDGSMVQAERWPGLVAARRNQVEEVELRIRRRDTGLSFTGAYTATPIHDADGNVSLVIISIVDVSASRRAEEGLRQRDRHLATALAAGDTGTFRWTLATDLFEPDHPLEQLLGTAPRTIADLLERLSPGGRDEARTVFSECAERGQDLELETPLPGEDGQDRWLAWRGRVLRDASSAIVAVTGACQDVTGRRQLEERLRLMERADSVGRLAGGVAHEVNNQMSVVLGCADFVLRHTDLPPDVRQDVEQMRQAGERSAAVTSQLLAFSRRQMLRPELVEVNTVVRAIAPALARTLGEDRRLRLLLSAPGAMVRADIGQLHQALINLTLNAREATGVGGELRIETSMVSLGPEYGRLHSQTDVREGRYVALAVSDTGRGMSRETVARAFEPFFTTKEIGEGTGLGLSTVYGIVKQSGGYVWIYSEPGQGTVFKIYLPLDATSTEVMPEPVAPTDGDRTGEGTVLVVEDEPAVRAMIVRTLREAGFEVLEAGSAADGLAAARQAAGELVCVVTDVVMPDLDGRSLAEQLSRFTSVPVLFMSGYTDADVTLRGLLQDGLPFLQKPFPPSRLVRALQQLLSAPTALPDPE